MKLTVKQACAALCDFQWYLADNRNGISRHSSDLAKVRRLLRAQDRRIRELERKPNSALVLAHRMMVKRMPNLGAWENTCPFCRAETECGDISHKPDCAFEFTRVALEQPKEVRRE